MESLKYRKEMELCKPIEFKATLFKSRNVPMQMEIDNIFRDKTRRITEDY